MTVACQTRLQDPPIPSACEVSRGTLSMLGSSRQEIVAILGPPSAQRSEDVPNRHVPGEMDRMHYLEWEGLQITVHAAPVVEREFLSGVIATGRSAVPISSWIGRSREELIEELGQPVHSTGTASARWECFNELAPETIEVEFEDEVAVKATLRYPID